MDYRSTVPSNVSSSFFFFFTCCPGAALLQVHDLLHSKVLWMLPLKTNTCSILAAPGTQNPGLQWLGCVWPNDPSKANQCLLWGLIQSWKKEISFLLGGNWRCSATISLFVKKFGTWIYPQIGGGGGTGKGREGERKGRQEERENRRRGKRDPDLWH